MDESCQVCRSHVSQEWHMSCASLFLSEVCMSHIIHRCANSHINESCYTWLVHVTRERVKSRLHARFPSQSFHFALSLACSFSLSGSRFLSRSWSRSAVSLSCSFAFPGKSLAESELSNLSTCMNLWRATISCKTNIQMYTRTCACIYVRGNNVM